MRNVAPIIATLIEPEPPFRDSATREKQAAANRQAAGDLAIALFERLDAIAYGIDSLVRIASERQQRGE